MSEGLRTRTHKHGQAGLHYVRFHFEDEKKMPQTGYPGASKRFIHNGYLTRSMMASTDYERTQDSRKHYSQVCGQVEEECRHLGVRNWFGHVLHVLTSVLQRLWQVEFAHFTVYFLQNIHFYSRPSTSAVWTCMSVYRPPVMTDSIVHITRVRRPFQVACIAIQARALASHRAACAAGFK